MDYFNEPKQKPGYTYVPVQHLDKVYSPNAALKAGTIFPELNITIEEYERGLWDGK
ncbi:MAG: spore coat associated protein CotJA [Oscillospiraceae bacterium]